MFVRETRTALSDYELKATAEAPREDVETSYQGDLSSSRLDWVISEAELARLPFEITSSTQIRRVCGARLVIYMPTPNAAGEISSPEDDDRIYRRYRCLKTGEESV